MTARLYLDEDFLPGVARALRDAGYDVVSAHDIGLLGVTDEHQLDAAIQQQRAILSANHHDFRRIAREYEAKGRGHFGIVLSMRQYRRAEMALAVDLITQLLDATDSGYLTNLTVVLDDFKA